MLFFKHYSKDVKLALGFKILRNEKTAHYYLKKIVNLIKTSRQNSFIFPLKQKAVTVSPRVMNRVYWLRNKLRLALIPPGYIFLETNYSFNIQRRTVITISHNFN